MGTISLGLAESRTGYVTAPALIFLITGTITRQLLENTRTNQSNCVFGTYIFNVLSVWPWLPQQWKSPNLVSWKKKFLATGLEKPSSKLYH